MGMGAVLARDGGTDESSLRSLVLVASRACGDKLLFVWLDRQRAALVAARYDAAGGRRASRPVATLDRRPACRLPPRRRPLAGYFGSGGGRGRPVSRPFRGPTPRKSKKSNDINECQRREWDSKPQYGSAS